MSVQSREVHNERPVAPPPSALPPRPVPARAAMPVGRGDISTAALAIAFGGAFWLVGSKYTLDGWVVALNVLLAHLTLPARIPAAVGWWVLLALPLGAAYSWVEVRARPSRPTRAGLDRWLVAAALWLAVIGTDVGSTFLGVQSPGPQPWGVSAWLAATDWAGALWALVLTFSPEAFILYGIRRLR